MVGWNFPLTLVQNLFHCVCSNYRLYVLKYVEFFWQGIEWTTIEYFNNAIICDLIEKVGKDRQLSCSEILFALIRLWGIFTRTHQCALAPCKRTQHRWPTSPNILHTLLHVICNFLYSFKRLNVSVRSRSNWNLELLIFEERGKPGYPKKNLSERRRKSTTNSTHIWRGHRDLNPGPIGGRRLLSPLRHPCATLVGSCCAKFETSQTF